MPQAVSRIGLPVDEGKLVTLHGNTRPEAKPEFDKGRVDPQLRMDRMLLVLQRSPEQEAALEAFMKRQLDPASPDFHHWLSPEEFGALYGPADLDIQIISSWLQGHGFTVDSVSKGRTFIEFSGTAALVQRAFHSEIHHYLVDGEEHIANSSDPSIPEALSPVVAGIFSLNNFFAEPLHRYLGTFRRDPRTAKWAPDDHSSEIKPLFAVSSGGGTYELVAPYDFAAIYNVAPLWTAGIDGTGQTIAIAGRSDISLTDVATFRSAFGLPANVPTIIVNGTDPGVPSADDKVENTLDVEWSGGVARGAAIKFVTTASTQSTDGSVASVLYIVDNAVAPVLSYSYGSCELALGTAGNAGFNSLWQQGAAEGISEFVASGDQGAASCDGGGAPPDGATQGLQVSGTSSTPYDIAVGGTDLNWANNPGTTYWSSLNNPSNNSNALGYMPEVPWNGTCVGDAVDQLYGLGSDEEQACQFLLNYGIGLSLVSVIGGTGGVSACTTPGGSTPSTCSGGYAKPAWQTGAGVPSDGKRDVPDVSLFASNAALLSAYVICDSQSTPCTYSNSSDAIAQGVGGTSVSSPAMAGIMALVNQKMNSPQGNANAGFYALAARDTRASCNTNTVASGNACNFYDITTDDNAVPCIPGYPDCTLHHIGDSVGVLNGYRSTTGYDLTTGLGSINANNLVNNWHLIASSTLIPVVTTGAASAVTASTASLAGTVNPEGSSTQSYFLYGTSSTLSGATQTAMQGAGSGSTAVAAAANLTGLSLNTTYYYQLWASNSAGSSAGAINSFTTSTTGTLPVVSTGAATSVTSTAATLNGTVNPNGASTNVSFLYGTSSTLSGASSTSPQNIGSVGIAQPVSANISGLSPNTKYYYQAQATNSAGMASGIINSFTTPAAGLQFISVTPCRIADTRNPTGPFGGPEMSAGSTREFDIPQSACNIPSTAVAYSLNITVVPNGPLSYLTLWPAGQAQPLVSTLNSDGRIKANAAIIPAGTNGGVDVYVTDATQVVIDIDGYFVPAGTTSALAFYPVTPCRVADTRNPAGPLGGPTLSGWTSRAFPVQSSACGIPSTAQAYSLNVTAVPHGTLGYLTMWPTGQTQPYVSTLNSPTGEVVANAAIVPAGTGGEISIFVTDTSDVVLDIDGYFAPPGTGGLSLYTVSPCRVVDTRNGAGAFSGTLTVNVEGSPCSPPATAQGYVFNATVVPSGYLGYLTLWPNGGTQPLVSTLNATDGTVTSNMAIVPTTNGSINAYATNLTQLVLDLSSYFAP